MNMTRFGAAMNGRSLSRYLYNTPLPNESLVALKPCMNKQGMSLDEQGLFVPPCLLVPDVFLTLFGLPRGPVASSQTISRHRQIPLFHVV